MKILMAMTCATTLLLASSSEYPALAQTAQQNLMKTCNTQASDQKLLGDARKTFMSNCLSGKSAKTLTPQQQKMQSCNAQAGVQKLSGDSRKQFMSSCLKS